MLLALSVLWGGSFFFVEVAVGAIPPLTLVLLRVGGCALVLWAVVAMTGGTMPARPEVWRAFLVMGLLNNAVPFSLIVWGQAHLSSSLAAILNATTPLFTVIVAGLVLADERMTPGRVAGVGFGFLGVVVLMGGGGWGEGGLLPYLACLGGAISYACAGVFGRRFQRLGVTPLQTAAGQVTASTLFLLPLALGVDRPWTLPAPGPEVVAAVAGLVVLSTALAYLLYFRILAVAGATNLLLVTFLIPVSAILLGIGILGEAIGLREVAGMAIIGIGLAAVDGRPAGRLKAAVRGEGSLT
ncbi:Permease of the drug/metabolite transporter (DMT) superfamily [Caenispirillum salinarum AK4]|uniref:Permease of the drug/metabolite transporter (DMT) superfamily n=2 Tax=Caenispirillum TaxID=414051 RepID=K9HKD6_9PROT|nr:Permease of the drug/metabolite transporter (DMT) superfamily [Caenispirillum salinarum AK4]